MKAILGIKTKMSQAFVQGMRVPVTRIKADPNIVTQLKTKAKDGYWAVQIGLGEKKVKKMTRPEKGHLKGATKDKKAPRFLAEIRLAKKPELKVGDQIKVADLFQEGDKISITGTSKGKGFAGGVKRWGFKGGPRTHGQSDRPRSPGSIGQGTNPGRVHKGKKMAGRMGGETVTLKRVKVIKVDPEKNEIDLAGPIPGRRGSLLILRKEEKRKTKKEENGKN